MINLQFSLSYFEIYLIVINIVAFFYYAFDKRIAIKNNPNSTRVPERNLLLASFIGGTVGAVISMISFRHKIKKISFVLKFVFVSIIQVLLGYFYFL